MTGKGTEEPEMTVTAETSGMTVDLIILAFAQGTDTTLGAWPVGTVCLSTQMDEIKKKMTMVKDKPWR